MIGEHILPSSSIRTDSNINYSNSSEPFQSSVEDLFSSLGYDKTYVNSLLDVFNKENVFKVSQLEFIIKKLEKNTKLKNYNCSRCGKSKNNAELLSKVDHFSLSNKLKLYDDIICVLYSFGDINVNISFWCSLMVFIVYLAIPALSIVYNFSLVRFIVNSVVMLMGVPLVVVLYSLISCSKHDPVNSSHDILGIIIALTRNNLFNFNMSKPAFSNCFANRLFAVMEEYVTD